MTLQHNLFWRNTTERYNWRRVKSKVSPCSGSAATMQLNPISGPFDFFNISNKRNQTHFKPMQKSIFLNLRDQASNQLSLKRLKAVTKIKSTSTIYIKCLCMLQEKKYLLQNKEFVA